MHQPGIEQRPLQDDQRRSRSEFGQVLFDGARVPAANMIGEPGEGWALAMTVVSHEREPAELGYVARYSKLVKELEAAVRAEPDAFRPDQVETLGRAYVESEMLRLHVRAPAVGTSRRDHARPRRIDRQVAHDRGRAGRRARRARGRRSVAGARRRRHLAEGVPLQPRAERHGRHVADPEEHHRDADPRPSRPDPERRAVQTRAAARRASTAAASPTTSTRSSGTRCHSHR